MTKLYFIMILTGFTFDALAQLSPGIQWQNNIGGSGLERLYAIQQTSNGGYILGGYSDSNLSGDKTENCMGFLDYWLIKCDFLGNIQWQNTIGGSSEDLLYTLLQTSDGGYLLGGWSRSPLSGDKTENSNGFYDYWIIRTDSVGNLLWQNTIGGNDEDYLYALIETMDGGYLLGGFSWSGISGDKTNSSFGFADYWIVKIDFMGNIQWQRTIGGSQIDALHSLQQTSDGGYLLGGYSRSDSSGNKTENSLGGNDYWIVKTDSLGDILWQNTIGGSGEDFLYYVDKTFDGGFILGGASISGISADKTEINKGGYDYWIVKTDSLGNIQWDKTIGGSTHDAMYSVHQTIDSEYILGGWSLSNISGDKTENSNGLEDYWVVRTDTSGLILWQETIGGSAGDLLYTFQPTSDGGYILAGESDSGISGDKTENNIGGMDYWIVKLHPDPATGISPEAGSDSGQIVIFPNPSRDFITITAPFTETVTLKISDIYGRDAGLRYFLVPESSDESISIDIRSLSSGIYMVEVKNKTICSRQLFVKQ